MNIAVLTNDYPPDSKGGAGVIAEKQVKGLEEKGHAVRVWHERASWLDAPFLVRAFHHLRDLMPRKDITLEIIDFKPDLLLTHNLTGLGFGTPGEIQKRVPCTWFHVLHDVQLFEPSGSLKNERAVTWTQKIWSYLRGHTFGRPDLVLSPTAWLAEAHRARGWFKDVLIEILPNPGRPQDFTLRHPHQPFQLLFLGGNSKAKGAALMRRLSGRLNEAFEMHVAGDALHDARGSRMRSHGRLTSMEVIELMKETDVLLVPSQIAENQPTVILEAASVGLPIIASDIGGIRETLGKAGVLCPPDDEQAWLTAIQQFLDIAFYQEQAVLMFELSKRYSAKRHLDRLHYLCEERRKTRT